MFTVFKVSKYVGGLLSAVNAASWKGAGAESVILMWIFLIADAMLPGAQAQPILHPVENSWTEKWLYDTEYSQEEPAVYVLEQQKQE